MIDYEVKVTETAPPMPKYDRMQDREFWLLFRQALLLMVDAIERRLEIPRTAELRKNNNVIGRN